jgi:thiamine-phosphate pyrophosphorylase
MHPNDLSLYFVVHHGHLSTIALMDIVLQAIEGGVTIVQLREKECSFEEFCSIGRELLKRLRPLKVPLIINDRVDVAKAIGADGVHLGQSDLNINEARRILGPEAIIGLTVETLEQGMQAANLDVNYLGAGPLYPTDTKLDCGPAWQYSDLEKLCRLSPHPIVGIGGIKASNAGLVLKAKLAGIAVVSAILNAPDPKAAAAELKRIIQQETR